MSPAKTAARTRNAPNPILRASGRPDLTVVEPEDLAALVQRAPCDLDNYDATVWLLDQLRSMPDGLGVAFTALHAYVTQTRRNQVRGLEQAVIRQFTPGDGTKAARSFVGELSLLQLSELKDAQVKIPGRTGLMRGGAVTIREWELRDQFLAKKESGIARTRSYVRAVIRTLKSNDCVSIDEALKKGQK